MQDNNVLIEFIAFNKLSLMVIT